MNEGISVEGMSRKRGVEMNEMRFILYDEKEGRKINTFTNLRDAIDEGTEIWLKGRETCKPREYSIYQLVCTV